MAKENWDITHFKYHFHCKFIYWHDITSWLYQETGLYNTSCLSPYSVIKLPRYSDEPLEDQVVILVRIMDPDLAVQFALMGYHYK